MSAFSMTCGLINEAKRQKGPGCCAWSNAHTCTIIGGNKPGTSGAARGGVHQPVMAAAVRLADATAQAATPRLSGISLLLRC